MPLTYPNFKFDIFYRSSSSSARLGRLHTPHGFIETPHGVREVKELTAHGVDVSEDAIRAAQGRLGKPEDIARAALYLASDDAEFVNGAQLFVDNCFSAV